MEIQKVSWWHDKIIDQMVASPTLHQGEIAATMGYTQGWMSIMVNSDAFKERLAERKAEIVDPTIRASLEEKFRALADMSMQVIMRQLEANPTPGVALKALDIASRAYGYGKPSAPTQNVQVNVAVVPEKALNGHDWVEAHFSKPTSQVRVADQVPAPASASAPDCAPRPA